MSDDNISELSLEQIQKYEHYMKSRPHVVILGAGASCAAIPHGDKNGRQISAMKGFIDRLGLRAVLNRIEISTRSDNLEDIYMELDRRSYNEPECDAVKHELDSVIRNYMGEYQLPDEPNIYDFIVLSLTSKDLIATFNWDPFLVQAMQRAGRYENGECLPHVAFLHGNVSVGFCEQDMQLGNIGAVCHNGHQLMPMPLLYPVENKDYSSDPAIAACWREFNNVLGRAYMVTIFGYSAPVSDAAALEAMQKAWGNPKQREYEQFEIINRGEREEVLRSWENFIFPGHCEYYTSFFDTSLAKFPRRTCEVTYDMTMKCRWTRDDIGFKEGMTRGEIEQLIRPLVYDECRKRGKRELLSNPYIAD